MSADTQIPLIGSGDFDTPLPATASSKGDEPLVEVELNDAIEVGLSIMRCQRIHGARSVAGCRARRLSHAGPSQPVIPSRSPY